MEYLNLGGYELKKNWFIRIILLPLGWLRATRSVKGKKKKKKHFCCFSLLLVLLFRVVLLFLAWKLVIILINCFKARVLGYSTWRSDHLWCMLIHPSLLVCFPLVTEGQCPKAAVVSVLHRLPAPHTVRRPAGTTDDNASGLGFVCRSFCGTESCECCCQGSCLCKLGLGERKMGNVPFSMMCLNH